MYTLEIRGNGVFNKSVALKKEKTVNEIIELYKISKDNIIAYKKNCDYVSSNEIFKEDGKLDFIFSTSREGFRILQETTLFVMMKAWNNLFPDKSKLVVEHSIGDGIYCEVFEDNKLKYKEVQALKNEMKKIINEALPIEKIKVNKDKAQEIFQNTDRDDILKNLTLHNLEIYKCGNYHDYYLRQLSENTSYVHDFELIFLAPGLIVRFPRRKYGKIQDDFRLSKKLFEAHQEHDKWLSILDIHNVSSLNRATDKFKISPLIQIEEALHEKKIVDIAEHISRKKDVKVILIAGPTSSGKTTFAKRLSIQLRVIGITPKLIGMDDYFVSRARTPIKENGEFDFECLEAIDLKLLNQHLIKLLNGEEVELPKYNFLTGISENSFSRISIKENEIIILEGIHGLNDKLTSSVPFNQKVKIYVSALNNLNLDSHNRIPTTDSRKIRRILRDTKYRGHSAEKTLNMWDSVRDGEDVNIFPFQENADYLFNSILTYEIAVLKKYVLPLLEKISCHSNQFSEAQRLIKLFRQISGINDSLVPSNSILREFIGGSVFSY
ncbi:MAG: nucleoside kinase [Candidatus Cloacimonetes bacterium]|nr:nucleoside kinase [Candidatus Cloacimonadota bacterium]